MSCFLCRAGFAIWISFFSTHAYGENKCVDGVMSQVVNDRVKKAIADNLARTQITEFPEVSVMRLQSIKPLKLQEGDGNNGLREAVLDGKKVFIKIPTRNEVRQMAHSANLDEIGIGPKFYGWTRLEDGQLGLVYEHFEGVKVSRYFKEWPKEIPLTPELVKNVRAVGRKLAEAGYKHVEDLQFMINAQGEVRVIDPEMFSYEVPRQFLTMDRIYWPLEDPVKVSEAFARRIEHQIELQKK